ncbi:MAG: hypothetical protein EPO51_03165 [Phenylobacterium sp.]|uniref:hypothetical protein n=1 Tax=Phenylobacterium sp. TaxID=1871053 RepID=UPI0011F502A5|nr:hypothetical protein [Phenylobacterium sp.]TAJ73850.1 MAG: hypothetical protein EPO51_03165 [Phenylobacterium sp.]
MSWLPTLFELVAGLGAELFLPRAIEGRPLWLRIVLVAAWIVLAFALATVLLLLLTLLFALFR